MKFPYNSSILQKKMFIIAPISVENGNKAGEMLCNWQVTTNVCALSASQSDALFVCLVRFQNTEVATCTAKMLSLRLHNKTSIITGERQDGYFYIQSVHQTGKACVVWLGNVKLYKQEKLAKSKTITLICFPLFKICGRQKISFAAMQCHDIAVLSMIEWLSEYLIVFLLQMNLKSKVKREEDNLEQSIVTLTMERVVWQNKLNWRSAF